MSTETFTVELDNASRSCVIINNKGDVIGTYPYVWLRDNCRCSQCFHPSSRGRLILMANLDPDIIPAKAEIKQPDQELDIQWQDNHNSQFSLSWLQENRFSDLPDDPVNVPTQQLWGKELEQNIPKFTYKDVTESDKCLHDWIEALQVYGLAIIKYAPQEKGALHEIGKRISILKITNYGETFQVFSKFEASNLAYTNAELGLHTDLPFYEYPPNIQMLHCIKQVKTTGGENQFCDAFKVVEDFRQNDPEVFRLLSTTLIDFRDWGKDYNVYHMKRRAPLIELFPDGRLKAINYNDQVRAPYQKIPVQDIYRFYCAIKKFNNEIYKATNMIETKLEGGDIACFDNQRVLHGRSGFVVTEASSRHYEGAYIDWDEARSRMRVIRDKMLNQQPL